MPQKYLAAVSPVTLSAPRPPPPDQGVARPAKACQARQAISPIPNHRDECHADVEPPKRGQNHSSSDGDEGPNSDEDAARRVRLLHHDRAAPAANNKMDSDSDEGSPPSVPAGSDHSLLTHEIVLGKS